MLAKFITGLTLFLSKSRAGEEGVGHKGTGISPTMKEDVLCF